MTFFNKILFKLGFREYSLHESSLGRIYQHSQNSTIGTLTAFRGENTLATNRNRNKGLENAIRSSGFGFVKVTGHYVESPGTPEQRKVVEESFLVISAADDNGKLKGFLKKYGREYEQDSVLYKVPGKKAVLIGTKSGVWPGLGVEFEIGDFKPNKIADIYSKMKGGRTYVFEGVEAPDNLFTIAYKTRDK